MKQQSIGPSFWSFRLLAFFSFLFFYSPSIPCCQLQTNKIKHGSRVENKRKRSNKETKRIQIGSHSFVMIERRYSASSWKRLSVVVDSFKKFIFILYLCTWTFFRGKSWKWGENVFRKPQLPSSLRQWIGCPWWHKEQNMKIVRKPKTQFIFPLSSLVFSFPPSDLGTLPVPWTKRGVETSSASNPSARSLSELHLKLFT